MQWVLPYIQRGLADIWKENMIENLETGILNYAIVRKFLSNIKQEFGEEDDKTIKVAELKRMEQESKTIKKFV